MPNQVPCVNKQELRFAEFLEDAPGLAQFAKLRERFGRRVVAAGDEGPRRYDSAVQGLGGNAVVRECDGDDGVP